MIPCLPCPGRGSVKRWAVFVLLILWSAAGMAQMQFIRKTVRTGAIGLDVDPIGNYYLHTRTEIFKYNPFDTLFSRYSELQNGNISFMDVSNPMKITVFYANVSKVVFLDNTLNPTFTPTDLYALQLETATLVCSSYDNGFWVFDAPSFSLTRVNGFGEVDRTVKNINQLTGVDDLKPTALREKENLLYLADPDQGLFVFDIFGGFLKKWSLPGITDFSVIQKNIFYLRENRLYKFDTRLLEESSTELPHPNVRQVRVEKDRLYLLTRDGELYIYRF